MTSLYLFGPQWDLRGSLLIGKFRGNQLLTPGLTMSNDKRSVIVPCLHICLDYTLVSGHTLILDVKININLKSAHEITLEIIELTDLLFG